jgi:hypothetical protein
MVWRKSWAKNWADVKYCSDACRARKSGIDNKPAATRTPP